MKLLFRTGIQETGGKVAWLRSKGSSQILELNWYPSRYTYGGTRGLDHLAFEVEDARDYYRRLSRNHEAPIEPFREGRWILAYVKDPDGNWIELGHQVKKKGTREKRRRKKVES